MKRDLYLLALLPVAIFCDALRTAVERLDTYLADSCNPKDER